MKRVVYLAIVVSLLNGSLFGESAEDLANHGLRAWTLHSTNEAIADFTQAIQTAPQDPQPLFDRGLMEAMQGDFSGAAHDYDSAISLKPDFVDAY